MNSAAETNGSTRRAHGDAGFTLIEVMVVVLIIGILLAVGIPTFLGARERAQDRSAQSSLRVAQTTALVVYTDEGDYKDISTSSMSSTEPGFTWLRANAASNDDKRISVAVNSAGTEFGAAAKSDSGECFYIRVRENGSTLYGSSSRASCTGNSALSRARSSEW